MYFTPSEWESFVEKLPAGSKPGTFIREAALSAINRTENKKDYPPIPLLGAIPGGPSKEVIPFEPVSTVQPPFKLNEDCYALVVVGDSMESDHGVSIPNGSFAFFCPDRVIHYGSIVHVEWEGSDNHEATLKKYCPQPDGTVRFEPLNKSHKVITKHDGEFVVKGAFVRAWDGKSKA